MDIVKIPKQLRDILDTLRSGQIESGLAQLAEIKEFEPQKAIVLAEFNYFSSNYELAMVNDEKALLFDEQWYAGNILSEHFFAYTSAAIISNHQKRAENFYKTYLAEKKQSDLEDYRFNTYKHQVSQHLAKLKGKKNLTIDPAPLKVIKNGKEMTGFIAQLKKYKPKLTHDSVKGAEYLLGFMFEEGNTDESLAYYEKYAEELTNGDNHLHAARLFLLTGELEKAKTAIRNYVKIWYPVEYIQITPMRLWEFEDLYPILTKEFKEEILRIPKARS
ncbi:hypothetical protein HDE69_004628 [Pedobacter cryoconitis]|uniref:Uncharacterized protein n=1 Tax=Pedobacter cryoconitis TaxID=188932 RepID=A0A7W9DLR2_9SPHI|nr:hypothetical protein [Pedobacter cryoconitis]MBB5623542.1 hypothetical protein [Pedobacter cryoconitis]